MGNIFLSYSRANRAFAERLKIDLERAGVAAWLDTHDIPADTRWWSRITAAIDAATHFVLLQSPEAARSKEIARELEEAAARGKPVLPLLVAGIEADLPADWRDRQHIDFRGGYWKGLPRLLRELGAPAAEVPSVLDLVHGGPVSVAAAADVLGGAPRFDVAGRRYLGLAVEPSGYATTWLVGPGDAGLTLPARPAMLLKFTGSVERGETLPEVIAYLREAGPDDTWVVYVQGPRDAAGGYKLPLDARHVWADAVRASGRAVHEFGRGRRLDLFLECPAVLGFAVAAQARETGPYRLYQLNRSAARPADRYGLVLERDPS